MILPIAVPIALLLIDIAIVYILWRKGRKNAQEVKHYIIRKPYDEIRPTGRISQAN